MSGHDEGRGVAPANKPQTQNARGFFKPRAHSCYIGNRLSGQETGLLFLPMTASRFCL
jgi:hypothetical protein